MTTTPTNNDSMKYLYSYEKFTSDRHKARLRQLLHQCIMYFPSPATFNDPFDCKTLFDLSNITDEDWRKFLSNALKEQQPALSHDEHEKTLNATMRTGEFRLKEWQQRTHSDWLRHLREFNDALGVKCFSKYADNILLWSHYADAHSGVVLQFDYAVLKNWQYCQEVNYTDTFPTFHDFINGTPEQPSNLLVFQKARDWAYEEEYRLVLHPDMNPLKNAQNQDGRLAHIPPEALIGVIAGCEMHDSDRTLVKDIIRSSPMKLLYYEAVKSKTRYAVEIQERSIEDER